MIKYEIRDFDWLTFPLIIVNFNHFFIQPALAISESWLNSKVRNAEVEMDGYELFRLDRVHKPGGGVCGYVRTDIKGQKLNHTNHSHRRITFNNYGFICN